MASQYRCGSDRRRQLVLDSTTVNGIDYLTVDPDETTLRVRFLHDLPGTGGGSVPPPPAPALTAAEVAIDGGVRFPDIRVVSVTSAGPELTVTVDRPGDFSEYRLRLHRRDGTLPPDGFDVPLASVRFTFKVDCPSGFDCRDDDACPADLVEEPAIDYLAKDYASFRRLMLDRLSVLMPGWRERNPADLEIALVELLAYVGDRLSYFQDAVATEAYLGTARRRASIRRHARLLDYRIHDGCNARTWIHVTASADLVLPKGTPVAARSPNGDGGRLEAADLAGILAAEGPIVFETADELKVRSAHNEIRIHTWSEIGCCLPAGSTRATLVNDPPVALAVGDDLLFEELRGATGEVADADPTHRQVVRLTSVMDRRLGGSEPLTDPIAGTPIVEIEWDQRDALAFPLCVSALADDGTTPFEDLSVARANVVLADHGLSLLGGSSPAGSLALDPDTVPEDRPYRPLVSRAPLTCAAPVDATLPASQALVQDPAKALPVLTLRGDDSTWTPQRDLLASDRFASEFVAEIEADGAAQLRFGDGALGRQPSAGSAFTATGRIGNGTAGNVGADSLTRIFVDDDGVAGVRNPLPAVGGADPELAERARLLAPRAFLRQERAVTDADYATIAMRRPGVGRAAGRIRWTGSWYTAVVTVDRPGGETIDDRFRSGLIDWLDLHRMAGVDLDLGKPVDVPLDIALDVCVASDQLAPIVKRAVLDVLSSRQSSSGALGFFHPDRWTFGQPVYLSQLYRAVMGIDGISWVDATRFQRLGRPPNHELEDGVIRTGPLEIARLDNDRNFAENGQLTITMRGGR
jgi:hypothetical protein